MTIANVQRDSDAWAKLLGQAGFEMALLANPSLSALQQAINSLGLPAAPERRGSFDGRLVRKVGLRRSDTMRPAPLPKSDAIVVVFYSGIGVTTGGLDYLAAKDTRMEAASDVTRMLLPLRQTLQSLRDRFRVSIVILDTNFNAYTPRPPKPKAR